jgi:hypothetical protein
VEAHLPLPGSRSVQASREDIAMGFFGRTSKTSGCARIGVLATAAVVALACHYFDDDSGSSFISPSQFEGTWQGTLRDTGGSSVDLELEFDSDSNITSVIVDTTDTGLTGSVAFSDPNPLEEFARFYDFEMVDVNEVIQTSGSFYIDDRFEHGLLIYDNGDFAVVEKRVGGRPAGGFASVDLEDKMTPTRVLGVFIRWMDLSVIDEVGDWVIVTDSVGGAADIPYVGMIGGDVVQLDAGQDGEKTLDGGDPIGGNFTFASFDPMGVWVGDDTPGDPKPLIVIMSFDKTFAGVMECNDPNGFPECFFGLWPLKDCTRSNYTGCALN